MIFTQSVVACAEIGEQRADPLHDQTTLAHQIPFGGDRTVGPESGLPADEEHLAATQCVAQRRGERRGGAGVRGSPLQTRAVHSVHCHGFDLDDGVRVGERRDRQQGDDRAGCCAERRCNLGEQTIHVSRIPLEVEAEELHQIGLIGVEVREHALDVIHRAACL